MYDVLDFGANPTGVADSGAAFDNAIAAAVTNGAVENRMGDRVVVPVGLYRLDQPLNLYGNVLLEGVGTGVGNGGSRLRFGPGAGIIIHSSASSPSGAYAGGACVRGLDIFGTRPSFSEWTANVPFHVGQCIRNAGDNSAYYECVSANGPSPLSGATQPPATFSQPELSASWQAGQYVTDGTVRRSSDGDFGWYFVCIAGGKTGATEPHWIRLENEVTSEELSPVKWITHAPGPFLPVDGDLVWRTRCHSGVLMLAPGTVEHCYFENFANAGISVIAYTESWPITNANGWYVAHCLISNCGQGVFVRGTDANAGACVRVTAILIGYDAGPIPMPWGIPGDRSTSGGHGFHDLSWFGNTYIGCLAESTDGRGYCTSGDVAHRSALINCYAEENCYPGAVGRGTIVLGGAQFAGSPSTGFERHGEGLYLDPIYGVTNLKIRSHPDLPDVPLGALDQPGVHGFYTFTDNRQGNNFFGWSRGQNGFFPTGWTFGTMPYLPFGFFGVAGYDAPEGPHWRDFNGHWRGHGAASGQYYLSVSTTFDNDPRWIAGGTRAVGFRQEPPGGYVVDGTRYIGRIVTTAGYDGRIWEASATGYWSGNPASMVTPPPPYMNGFVYRCVRSGNSGPSLTFWPTTIGTEFDDTAAENPARWQCVGPVARYQYYGVCVDMD